MNENQPCERPAPGGPGMAPRWTQGDKQAVGTAYSTASRVWYTLARGILNEIYYPTIDRPQVRDVQFLITDGESFFHEEGRDLETRVEPLSPHSPGVRVTSSAPDGAYRIVKEIISDPHEPCVLVRARIEAPRTSWRASDSSCSVRRISTHSAISPTAL